MRDYRWLQEYCLNRFGSEAALQALLPVPRTPEELRSTADDRYLSLLARRVFRAGLRHAMVDARWPAFEKAFFGFDPHKVLLMGDEHIERLMQAIFDIERVWNVKIRTAKLNRWLSIMTEHHPPPAVSGRRLKLRYMTQAKTRPPSFILFASRPEALPKAYQRYIVNGIREDFKLPGTPIRLTFRDQGTKNPYKDKASKISQSGALSKHRQRQKPKGS